MSIKTWESINKIPNHAQKIFLGIIFICGCTNVQEYQGTIGLLTNPSAETDSAR